MTSPYLAGSTFTAASANLLAGLNVKMKSADAVPVNNSTVLVSDSDLIIPVLASKKYAFLAGLIYDSATAADLRVDFLIPTGATKSGTPGGLDLSVTGTSGILNAFTGFPLGIGGAGVGSLVGALAFGYVITGANAGNVQLQWAQFTANASNTTLRAGSWLALLLCS